MTHVLLTLCVISLKVECIWYPWINCCNLTNFSFLFLSWIIFQYNWTNCDMIMVLLVHFFYYLKQTHESCFLLYLSCSTCICLSRLSRHGLNGRNLIEFHDTICAIFYSILNSKLLYSNYKFHCTHLSWIRWLLFSQKHFL